MPRVRLSGFIVVPRADLAGVESELPNHVKLTREEPGCVSFEVTPSASDPSRFNVEEVFEDREAFERHQLRVKTSRWGRISVNVERYYDLTEELDLSVIAERFDVHRVKGWIAVASRLGEPMRSYRTRRIAKLMPDQELHVTIGGTRLGGHLRLNETIRAILTDSGFEVLERRSTSGSRRRAGEYPAVSIRGVSAGEVVRVLHHLERAAIQAKQVVA